MTTLAKTRLMYALAFVTLAALATASSLMLSAHISTQRTAAEVIDVAGRQRMLAQRIALLMSQRQPNRGDGQLERELDESLMRFSRAHHWLHHPPAGATTEHLAALFEGASGLDASVDRFLDAVARARTFDDGARADVIATALGPLLEQLETQVALHSSAAQAAIERAVRLEWAVLALMLLVLFVEARFIFWPLLHALGASLSQTRAALTDSEAREHHLRGVLEASADAFLVLDAKGERVGEASPRLAQWLPGVLDRPLEHLIVGADERAHALTKLAALPSASLTEQLHLLEQLPHTLEHQSRSFELTYRLLSPTPLRVLVDIKDLTLARELRATRVAKEQALKQLNAAQTEHRSALGRLAAGIAHEIATPAAYIQSNLDYALEELRVPRTPHVIEALRDSKQGVEQLRGVLEFARHLANHSGESDDEHLRDERVRIERIIESLRHGTSTPIVTHLEPLPAMNISSLTLSELVGHCVAALGRNGGSPVKIRGVTDERGDARLDFIEETGDVSAASLNLGLWATVVSALGGSLRTRVDADATIVSLTMPAATSVH